ncbi:MAG: 3-phosphoserine/phosphohydroxythreonine transaminase [Gammaproteobacteria bacterium]|nr:3-phosphoserine/phosphohydroxythreonine transaminase [Gammaproteobacteria bacterium]
MSTEGTPARYNYAPGPAQLPPEVVAKAAEAVRSFPPHGRSILELSHRSTDFGAIAEQAEADLRALLALPDDYVVLFLNGGARVHYTLWIQNLSAPGDRIGLVDSGFWSQQAIKEARKLREIRVLPDSPDPADYPDLAPADADGLAFLHYVSNETLTGLAMPAPQAACPLVCDRTSDFLSGPFDIRPYALCYAGSQKNFGTAGLTVLVIRRDCLREETGLAPGLSYVVQARTGCLYHTPPIYAWHVSALMLRWIREQGGLEEMERRARTRASLVYDCIDASSLYANAIVPRARSRMNVCFTLADSGLEAAFLQQAETSGLIGLRGHKMTGGMRASLYNAMPVTGAEALVEFMRDFERKA